MNEADASPGAAGMDGSGQEPSPRRTGSVTRRAALKGGVAAGTAFYVVPVIETLLGTDRVYAASAPPPPSPGCFTARTPIIMGDGTTHALAEVAVGDYVMAYDETRQEVRSLAVTKTFAHEAQAYLHLWLADGSRLEVTAIHPIARRSGSERSWIQAGLLVVGDQLEYLTDELDALGMMVVARIEPGGREEPVYNLEVDEAHTYFANGVLVHNFKVG